jgi:lysophospholipase L1-like esterase
MKPDFARDAFHLTPAGYRALNEALAPVLASVTEDYK